MPSPTAVSFIRQAGWLLPALLMFAMAGCGEATQTGAASGASADGGATSSSEASSADGGSAADHTLPPDAAINATQHSKVSSEAAANAPIANRVYQAPKSLDDAARKASLERLGKFIAKLGELSRQVDRSRIETDALLDSLDYDYQRIVDFVTHDIAFQQYPGLLRGARGTLVSGAGNALDQSLLLATLLHDAGYDARIVRGRLDAAQAAALLDGSAAYPEGGSIAKDDGRWRKTLDELQSISGAPDPVRFDPISEQPFFATATRSRDQLLSVLRNAGVPLAAAGVDPLRAEAEDYFWVEARKGASGGWSNLHPAFAGKALETPTPGTRYDGSLPEDVQQRLRVEVFIVRKLGGKLDTIRVAGPWERPTANLHGELLRFSNQPNTLDHKAIEDGVGQAVQRAQLFVPVLNGEPGLAFDLNGSTIDTAALGMDTFGAAGVIKTVGDKTESAANALSALGSSPKPDAPPPDLRALAAQWIEYTLIKPDGTQTRLRRPVMSRIGNDPWRKDAGIALAAMSEDAQRRELTVEQRIMLATGRYSESYVVDRAIRHLLDNADIWRLLVDYLHGVPINPRPGEDATPSPLPHLALFRFFDRGPALFGADIAYRAEPTLLVLRDGLVSDGVGFRGVDIVSNQRRVLSRGGDGLRTAPDKALAIGVWETVSEALAHANLPGADAHSNTFEVFAAAAKQGIDTRVLKPGDAAAKLGVPAGEQRLLANELERGFAVVVPDGQVASRRFGGWWRVDPGSGSTLGMTGDGRGQELAEYIIDITGQTLTLINSIKGYADCEKYANVTTRTCCLMEAHMRNVGGMALGGVIGASFGGSVSLMCDIGGMARAQVEGALGTSNQWKCTVFDNPDGVLGPGGVINTTAMGCGAFQDQ